MNDPMKKLTILCLSLWIAMAGTAQEWVLVTDASELQAGDQIVFACLSKSKVASNTIQTKNSVSYLSALSATFNVNELVSVPDNAAVFTLSGDASAWTLTNQDGKILGAKAVKSLAWDQGSTTWTITCNETKAVVANTNSEYGSIQYYNASGSTRFCNYTSTQTAIQIYRAAAPVPSVTISFEGFPYARTNCDIPTYKAGTNYTLPSFVPEKDGHALLAWQYGEEQFAPGANFTVPETDVLFTPVWDGEQSVETVNGARRATKLIRNGQLVILRDGFEYNVLGERIQ